jgi:hypothetical protein
MTFAMFMMVGCVQTVVSNQSSVPLSLVVPLARGVKLCGTMPCVHEAKQPREKPSDMKLAQFRKSLQAYDVWTPVAFSAALSLITVVTYVASGLSGAWIIPFVVFQPMTFWYVAASHRQTREHIKVLEARIQQLEGDKAASS